MAFPQLSHIGLFKIPPYTVKRCSELSLSNTRKCAQLPYSAFGAKGRETAFGKEVGACAGCMKNGDRMKGAFVRSRM